MNTSSITLVGIPVEFTPERCLTVHPLTRRIIERYKGDLKKLELGLFDTKVDAFDAQAAIIFECLRLNYPNLEEDDFNGIFNPLNMAQAWFAVNCDFQSLDASKKALAVLLSGTSTGSETPPVSLI